MRRRMISFITAGVILSLSGCTRYEPVSSPDAKLKTEGIEQTVKIRETETEASLEEGKELLRVEKDGLLPSYLTGEPIGIEKAQRRPVAVMISNDKAALPHYGIERAGVIYEAPVEGSMNRFMALFDDYDDLDKIGSVRSGRTYYTYFAREFDALYIHYGQSKFALPYLKDMDHINGIDGMGGQAFFRSKDKKAPHNAYTSFEKIQKAIKNLGYSQEYAKSYEGHYRFANPVHPVFFEDGIAASYLRPGYPYNNPWFEYNKEDGLYYRFQYQAPHKGSKEQLAVKNIIFQYCRWDYYKPSEYLNIDVHTSGTGYYFTNGKGILVDWKKDGEYGVTRYYNKEGQEILLNPGKTWVCIITSDRMDKAEFYGEQTD